jgi:hypothetical protein
MNVEGKKGVEGKEGRIKEVQDEIGFHFWEWGCEETRDYLCKIEWGIGFESRESQTHSCH